MAVLLDANEFEARYAFDHIRVPSQFDEFRSRSRAQSGTNLLRTDERGGAGSTSPYLLG